MGGAVSSGESNDELIDNLLESDCIKTQNIERIFRAVDRGLYYTDAYKSDAYKDLAWKDGNLHLSAPCIYSEVMENIRLEPGMTFLNLGSGTGYLSTMCGLIIGKNGANHGIELHPEVAEYARDKLEEFFLTSTAIDGFDFCPPQFVVGNCLNPISSRIRYDRIYCGAACPEECIKNVTDLLKVGGICVMPINDYLVQITRTPDGEADERKSLLSVSFATLIEPVTTATGVIVNKKPEEVALPAFSPPSLKELCRFEIRSLIRNGFIPPGEPPSTYGLDEGRQKRKRHQARQERRRASRLLVVQRRRAGGDEGDTGFVAVAYSLGNGEPDSSSDIERYVNQSSSDTDDYDYEQEHEYFVRQVDGVGDAAGGPEQDNEVPQQEHEEMREDPSDDDDDDNDMPELEDAPIVPPPTRIFNSIPFPRARTNNISPLPPQPSSQQSNELQEIRGSCASAGRELLRRLEAAAAAAAAQRQQQNQNDLGPHEQELERRQRRTENEPPSNGGGGGGAGPISTTWVRRLSDAYDQRRADFRKGIFNAVSSATRSVLGRNTSNNNPNPVASSSSSTPSSQSTAFAPDPGEGPLNPVAAPTSENITATTTKRRGSPSNNGEEDSCRWSLESDSSTDSDSDTPSTSSSDTSSSDDEEHNKTSDGKKNSTKNSPKANDPGCSSGGTSAESGIVMTCDDGQEGGTSPERVEKKKKHGGGQSKLSHKKKKKQSKKLKKPKAPLPPPAVETNSPPAERKLPNRNPPPAGFSTDEELNAERGLDNSPLARLKRNPVSIQMRNRIAQLPLPPPVQAYLNFYRAFD